MSWPTVGIIAAVGLAAAVLLVAWLCWLWWQLPKRQVERLRLTIRDPKARADVEDNLRKTIGQLLAPLLGGAAVLIAAGLGAVFAYLQLSRQYQASHELLISNQVSKGFEQLGSEKLVMRLGGIYALEGVMNTSEQYHQPVLEALSAFVRHQTRSVTDSPPATDVQAALTVIGRRAALPEPKALRVGMPDLDRAQIPQAFLAKAKLDGAVLHGTNLSGAFLQGANLSGALLQGANLSGAFLQGANLSGAFLGDANLSGAKLDGATLTDTAGLTQAQLDGACGTNVKLNPGPTAHGETKGKNSRSQLC